MKYQLSKIQSKELGKISNVNSVSGISYKERQEELNEVVRRHIEIKKKELTKNDLKIL